MKKIKGNPLGTDKNTPRFMGVAFLLQAVASAVVGLILLGLAIGLWLMVKGIRVTENSLVYTIVV